MNFLLKIEEVLDIEGRPPVILPGISESVLKNITVRRSDPIELRKPDGSCVFTSVESVEILDRVDRSNSVVVVLPAKFTKRDLPVGTEIWLRDP
jgi:hypothetical protein